MIIWPSRPIFVSGEAFPDHRETSTQAVCRSKRTEVQRASLSIQQLGRNERRLSRRFRRRSSCGEASVALDVPDLAVVLGAHGSWLRHSGP